MNLYLVRKVTRDDQTITIDFYNTSSLSWPMARIFNVHCGWTFTFSELYTDFLLLFLSELWQQKDCGAESQINWLWTDGEAKQTGYGGPEIPKGLPVMGQRG